MQAPIEKWEDGKYTKDMHPANKCTRNGLQDTQIKRMKSQRQRSESQGSKKNFPQKTKSNLIKLSDQLPTYRIYSGQKSR